VPVNKALFYPTENLMLRADFEKAKVDKERWGVCKGEMVVIKSNCPAYVEAFMETQGNWQESFARHCGCHGKVEEVTTMTSKVDDGPSVQQAGHGNKAQCGKAKVKLPNGKGLFYPTRALMTEQAFAHKERFGVCVHDAVRVKQKDAAFVKAFEDVGDGWREHFSLHCGLSGTVLKIVSIEALPNIAKAEVLLADGEVLWFPSTVLETDYQLPDAEPPESSEPSQVHTSGAGLDEGKGAKRRQAVVYGPHVQGGPSKSTSTAVTTFTAPTPDESKIQQLCGMGFDRASVVAALNTANQDVQAAVGHLLG